MPPTHGARSGWLNRTTRRLAREAMRLTREAVYPFFSPPEPHRQRAHPHIVRVG